MTRPTKAMAVGATAVLAYLLLQHCGSVDHVSPAPLAPAERPSSSDARTHIERPGAERPGALPGWVYSNVEIYPRPQWWESDLWFELDQSGPTEAVGLWLGSCSDGAFDSAAHELEKCDDVLARSDLPADRRSWVQRNRAYYADLLDRPTTDMRICSGLRSMGMVDPAVALRCPDGTIVDTMGIPTRVAASNACGAEIARVTFDGSGWVAISGGGAP